MWKQSYCIEGPQDSLMLVDFSGRTHRILKSYCIHSYGLFVLKGYRLEIRKEKMYKRSEFRRDIDFNCSLNGVIAEFS